MAFLLQPWSGIPFKVWGLEAGIQGMGPWPAAAISIVGRAVRMGVWAGVTRVVVGTFRGFIRDYSLFVLGVYLVLFFYGWWQLQA